jgi:hypothetical protein
MHERSPGKPRWPGFCTLEMGRAAGSSGTAENDIMKPGNGKCARSAFDRAWAVAGLAALGTGLHAAPAHACGGFFCGQQPVDQTAERILFEVGQDSVTMTTQISFTGDAADFAWVLPLSEVPLADSLAVYHQQALNALDANSGPIFLLPDDPACYSCFGCEFAGGLPTAVAEEDSDSSVTVLIRQEVGDYDVAVIESEDPAALVAWLRSEGYRITAAMEPYVARYTSEGLKFLALKLVAGADVKDLRPFRFTLPGTAPTIPLRMTALAAEPEMSIVTFVLADTRFEGKNWPNLEIANDRIRYNPLPYVFSSVATNWASLVAESVDEAGGQGWVTEFAGPSASYTEQVRAQVQNGNFQTEDDAAAAAELLAALEAHPYLTRLYTRLSAEEMTSDPVFGRSALGNVVREHQLSRIVDGVDQCSEDARESTDPCDFTTCGAGGLCLPVTTPAPAGTSNDSSVALVAPGCACVPGATARATLAPGGSAPTVICQDGRMSFLNAGDRETADADVLPDTCAGYDCGERGQCIAMNLTPTCVCDQGFVAVGSLDPSGARRVRCTEPDEAVPAAFYDKRLPVLPPELPGGRDVGVAEVVPMVTPPVGMPLPPVVSPSADFPMPRANPDYPPPPSTAGANTGGGGCNLDAGSGARGAMSAAALFGLAALALTASSARRHCRG